MAVDPTAAWEALVEHLGTDAWSRFVTETFGLLLVDRGGPMDEKELTRLVVVFAGEADGARAARAGAGRPIEPSRGRSATAER
ncbi:MAG: hypothetical protein AB7Q42_22745 [Acidimicrobiia bacterium]